MSSNPNAKYWLTGLTIFFLVGGVWMIGNESLDLGIYFTNTPPMGSFGAWLTILEK